MKIYKIKIDDEQLGMDAISLVEYPAVEVDFLAFSKDGKKMDFTSFDEEKREITGVVCLADTPILRKNDTYGIHAILFEKDTIKQMMLRYFKNGLGNQVNIEHQGHMIKGLTMIESYIKDSSRNISPVEFNDVPDGSWIATFKVENDKVWEQIKEDHTLRGFSLQGWFGYGDEVKLSEVDDYDSWLEDILK
jgi:hypothetical protein